MKNNNAKVYIFIAILMGVILLSMFAGAPKVIESVEEFDFQNAPTMTECLPNEKVKEIVYWWGDTPVAISNEGEIAQIVQAMGNVRCIEYTPEELGAGFICIELKYETQSLSLYMQTENVSIDGTRYRVNDAMSGVTALCREIAEKNK